MGLDIFDFYILRYVSITSSSQSNVELRGIYHPRVDTLLRVEVEEAFVADAEELALYQSQCVT